MLSMVFWMIVRYEVGVEEQAPAFIGLDFCSGRDGLVGRGEDQ
jgi:hypothetical protein